jgi:hypothetical protein
MLNEILISNDSSNFFKLFIEENNKTKTIRFFVNEILLPFGLEEYKNKYVINFELNNNKSSKEYESLIRKIEKNITNLIEEEDLEVKSIFYKKKNLPVLCRGYIKKNKNKFITLYKNKDGTEISLFDLKKNEIYNIELEISGIWKYGKSAGLYINIISLKNNN